MKRNKRKSSRRKYNNGGIDYGKLATGIGTIGGSLATGLAQQRNGRVNAPLNALGYGAKGALAGASLGPIGAIAGFAGGTIMGAINANKQNKLQNEQTRKTTLMNNMLDEQHGKLVSAAYPTKGVKGTVRHYEYGGISGGTFSPLASNAVEAKGATHKQGGIDAGDIEVENKEVNVNMGEYEVWFSNKLKSLNGNTFAKEAKKIMTAKGKAEKKLDATSASTNNTGKREIEIADMKISKLVGEQMQEQSKRGLPHNGQAKANNGAIIGAAPFLPYVDNLVNAGLTANTPNIPRPIMSQAADLKTNYNINPQLDEIHRNVRSTNRTLANSTSNSAVSRNNMIANTISSHVATNNLYGQKENMETQLQNKDALNKQQILNSNIEKGNRYNTAVAQRTDDIHQRVSANVANLASDAMFQVKENRLRDRDRQEIELMKMKYKNSGVMDRNHSQHLQDFMDEKITWEEYISIENRKNRKDNAKKDSNNYWKNQTDKLNFDFATPIGNQFFNYG